MTQYSDLLVGGYSKLQTQKNLSRLFCEFVQDLQTLSPEAQTISVQHLFVDMNKQIEKYNEQFQVILDELGILCKDTQTSQGIERFFEALLDLFRLAFSMYEHHPDKLAPFEPLLEMLVSRMDSLESKLPEDPLQQALMLQLTKSAWALSNARGSMEATATALRNQTKRKTRKQKRSHN